MKVYFDTNIYLDYLTDRSGKTGRNLTDCASLVFERVMKGELKLIVSDWNLKELQRNIDGSKTKVLFALIARHIIRVAAEPQDYEDANRLSATNFGDAFHVILARKAGADVIITRNILDFVPFAHLIKISLPEKFA